MRIGLIWAQAEGGAIGLDGRIPWRLPEDLAHFKDITYGCTVIMGRRTWESLPPRFRPLQGRRNIVVSRQRDWADDGAFATTSVDAAIEAAQVGDRSAPVWIIGGAQLYDATIDRADRLEVTHIRSTISGDTYAPRIGDDWTSTFTEPPTGWLTSASGLEYRFARYQRARESQ